MSFSSVSSNVLMAAASTAIDRAQYRAPDNLEVRQAFNALPRVGQGIFSCLVDYIVNSDFLNAPGDTLEIGAGNGMFWKNYASDLVEKFGKNGKVYITDLSVGMVSACREIAALKTPQVCIEEQDATKLSYQDNKFSRLIANFMLYELKDRAEIGVREIARVLNHKGSALVVTMDENVHMVELYSLLHKAKDNLAKKGILLKTQLESKSPAILPFCAGNAPQILSKSFATIERHDFNDSILVYDKIEGQNLTGPQFVVKYLQSLAVIQKAKAANELPESFFAEIEKLVLEEIKANGVFRISRRDVLYHCKDLIK